VALSDFEIGKIAEIVAGKVGASLDARTLRRVVDQVVDSIKQQQGNPSIPGVTCDAPRQPRMAPPTPGAPPMPRTYTSPSRGSIPVGASGSVPPDDVMLANRGGLYERIERTEGTRVIIAAFGKNRPGVVAAITKELAELNCNIEDISQTIMQDFFSMIMVVDISACGLEFASLSDKIKSTEAQLGMKVYVMHEDIFRYMHRI